MKHSRRMDNSGKQATRYRCQCNRHSMTTLFSPIQSPFHPDFSALFRKLDIAAQRFDTARNTHRALQKQPPDFFVGEFICGQGHNYARKLQGQTNFPPVLA